MREQNHRASDGFRPARDGARPASRLRVYKGRSPDEPSPFARYCDFTNSGVGSCWLWAMGIWGCKLLNPRVDQRRKSQWRAGFPCRKLNSREAGNLDAAKKHGELTGTGNFLAKAEQRSLLSPSVGNCDVLRINVIALSCCGWRPLTTADAHSRAAPPPIDSANHAGALVPSQISFQLGRSSASTIARISA